MLVVWQLGRRHDNHVPIELDITALFSTPDFWPNGYFKSGLVRQICSHCEPAIRPPPSDGGLAVGEHGPHVPIELDITALFSTPDFWPRDHLALGLVRQTDSHCEPAICPPPSAGGLELVC